MYPATVNNLPGFPRNKKLPSMPMKWELWWTPHYFLDGLSYKWKLPHPVNGEKLCIWRENNCQRAKGPSLVFFNDIFSKVGVCYQLHLNLCVRQLGPQLENCGQWREVGASEWFLEYLPGHLPSLLRWSLLVVEPSEMCYSLTLYLFIVKWGIHIKPITKCKRADQSESTDIGLGLCCVCNRGTSSWCSLF